MTRLRFDGVTNTLGAPLSNTGTTIVFASALVHDGGTPVPSIGGGDYIALSLLDDDDSSLREIVHLTAYTTGGVTGTITRGEEGTSGVAHAIGEFVRHAHNVADVEELQADTATAAAAAAAAQATANAAQPGDALLTAIAALAMVADRYIYGTGSDAVALGTITAYARTLLDDVDAATARGTLGLGTASTQPSSAFQPSDATLTALAALVTAADKLIYATGVDTFALTDLTSFARTLLDDANAAASRTTLGLGTMAVEAAADYVTKALYDANTILIATTDNTPIAMTVAASRFVGRKASGDIDDMTAAEAWAVLASGTGQPEWFTVAISDETTAITTGTAKITFRMPFAMTLTTVRASLTTASSSGTPTFDINESGSTILSTKLTIDANELTSTTAATPPVISDANLADDAEITIDIDVAGTGAKGAKITFLGTRA